MKCCVPFCKSAAETVSEASGITFHEFPSEEHLRAAWLRALGKEDSLPDPAVVCSQHFLNDDFCATQSGSRQIRTGAIPTTVQVCMICLDTRSKLLLMSKYKLEEAYRHLVGRPLCDQRNLRQTLCVQCAQRLVNFNKFRDKSLRAQALMMELVEQHEIITMQHKDVFDKANNLLKYNIVKTVSEPDYCDLYINSSDTDKQTDLDTTVKAVAVKHEERHEPMSVDEETNTVVRNDTDQSFNMNLVVTKEEYISDEEQKQLTDPLFVKPSTSKDQTEPLASVKYEITFECSICLEEFASEESYNYHMTMHMEENQSLAEDPSAEFGHSSVGLLNARVAPNTKHNAFNEGVQKLEIIPQETITPIIQKVVHNKFNKSKSKETSETNTGDVRFACKICNSKYRHKLSLHRHMRTHTGEYPYRCQYCDYRCTNRNNLVMHIRIHTGERPFACEICKFKFARKCDLVKHLKTHTGEKPYSCGICEYKFRLKSGLMEHMKTHTGDKPYSCELCDFKSVRNSDLARHIKSHTGEKPFACGLCDYKCIRRCNLAYHMTTHTGEKPFTCEICELKFSLKSNLRRHMFTHTGNK